MKFHLYSYFQHFGTSSSSSRYRRDAVPKKGPSAQRRCPPGAAWWGAHVDSSKVASKYLSAPQVPISPQALKPIWRGRRSNTPHNQCHRAPVKYHNSRTRRSQSCFSKKDLKGSNLGTQL
jgi:hypothetical protein